MTGQQTCCSNSKVHLTLKDLKIENFYIVCGHTDMRKSIDGLADWFGLLADAQRKWHQHASPNDVRCAL